MSEPTVTGWVRHTTESYIKQSKKLHGDYYDYSLTIFTGCCNKVDIICTVHGLFQQEARQHIKINPQTNMPFGCRKCGTAQRNHRMIEESKQDFFTRAPLVHDHYYTYNNVVFKGKMIHVMITCPKHGDFPQKPYKHLGYPDRDIPPQGCNKCGEERTADRQRMGKDEFIRRAHEKHGSDLFTYDSTVYTNIDTPVEIYCNDHEQFFTQTPLVHLHATHACPDCSSEKRGLTNINNSSVAFWEKANQDDQFDWSKYEYINATTKSILIHKKCDGEFPTSPNNYLSGKRCPHCVNKTELKLYQALVQRYPTLMRRFSADWCRNPETNMPFPFDFLIQVFNLIIELDGIQHFENVRHYRDTYEQTHERDLYKQRIANENGYSVIRIFQEDVWNDNTSKWLDELCTKIEKVHTDDITQNLYISNTNKYERFIHDFEGGITTNGEPSPV